VQSGDNYTIVDIVRSGTSALAPSFVSLEGPTSVRGL
jgi:hypothetical protein